MDDKAIVDEAFEFLVGNSVIVKDTFRLGKFRKPSGTTSSSQVQVRPILVKIATVWIENLL